MAGTERVEPEQVKVAPAPITVGAADDVAELDADRRADAALDWLAAQRPMDHPVPEAHVHTAACGIGRSHAPHSGATIGRAGGDLDGDTQRELESAVGGGQPLAAAVRAPMEQAFGTDLGRVRVHAGAQADRLSRSMSAEAFTTGHDIFFRQGAYDPDSSSGQRVLAHELGHVVQNRTDVRRKIATQVADLDQLATSGPKSLASSFSKVRDALAACQKATTPDKRAAALQKLNDLCVAWLNDHPAGKDPRTQERRQVVDRLVDEVSAELAGATQDQAQGIYLDNAAGESTGGAAKHNLQSITARARGTAKMMQGGMSQLDPNDPVDMEEQERANAAKAAGLSGAEYSAIATFTAQDYKYINPATANSPGWMKAQATNAHPMEKAEMFDGRSDKTLFEEGSLHTGVAQMGLKRLPVYDQVVYRGSCMNDQDLEKLKTNSGWACMSMASSSKLQSVAEGFANDSGREDTSKKLRVLMELEGHGGRDVESFSKVPHEKEVMLLADTQFALVSITQIPPPQKYAAAAAKDGHTWYLVKLKRKGGPPKDDQDQAQAPAQPPAPGPAQVSTPVQAPAPAQSAAPASARSDARGRR